MKAFVVTVNGKKLWTVGVGPNGVFSVIVGCGLGGPRRPAEGYFHFSIGGVDGRTEEHVEWKTPHLKQGDSVKIDLVEVDDFDPETRRFPFPGDTATVTKTKHSRRTTTKKRPPTKRPKRGKG